MDSTRTLPESDEPRTPVGGAVVSGLAIAWCADEPWRVGEVALLPPGDPGAPRVLGRGDSAGEAPRLTFARARPGSHEPQGGLASPRISREQLTASARGPERVALENVGRLRMRVNGVDVARATVGVGDVVELGSQLVFLVVRRNAVPARPAKVSFAFGEPDAHGIVGESPLVWRLREAIAFVARRPGHVLVTGPSGAGKELVASAIHASSDRFARDLLARNASTFPETLVDAELFGNAKNFPNPGMADRVGLIGDADGTTLFLDEIGELPSQLQAHLLRVLDRGEYVRLGESRSRRADLRVIAATNRSVDELKHDLLGRFALRVQVPGLDDRREDIPLLVRHRLRAIAASEPDVAARFGVEHRGETELRIAQSLASALLRRPYTLHVREVEAILWRGIAASAADGSDTIDLAAEDSGDASAPASGEVGSRSGDGAPLTAAKIQAALDAHNGAIDETARALGLSSRHALARLIKRHRLQIRRRPA